VPSSPCIRICTFVGEHCLGCFRTPDEVSRWSQLADASKQLVIADLDRRRQQHWSSA
jgi:hypothetical protein